MFKFLNRKSVQLSAAATAGYLASSTEARANDFSNVATNVITSIQSVPGLLSGLAYMFGILLGVLGILKIKDHVENPSNTPLKDGAIRLAAGGALFALPFIYEAMTQTTNNGNVGAATAAAKLTKVELGVN